MCLRNLFLIALMLLAPLAAQATDVFVNLSSDESGNLGTLRDALNNRASAGDTIIIQTNRIVLTDPLNIRLDGLTILGNNVTLSPARGINTPIIVDADGVVLDDMNFMDIEVSAGSFNSERPLQGFTVRNSNFRGRSDLYIYSLHDCLVEDNQINSRLDTGISLLFTERCVVRGNWVHSAGIIAVGDLESSELTIDDNDILGGGWLYAATESGLVNNNRLRGSGGIFIDQAVPDDHLRVTGNHAPWMTVERSNVEIIGNTLNLPADSTRLTVLRIQNESPGGARGPVIIHDNNITGGRNGLSYHGWGDRAGAAWITENNISGCSKRGMHIGATEELSISHNEVHSCGTSGGGIGLNLVGPVRTNLVVVDNDIHNIEGSGVHVRPPIESGRLQLEANRIFNNRLDGVQVFRDVGVPAPDDPDVVTEPGPGTRIEDAARGEVDEETADDAAADAERAGDAGIDSEPVLMDDNDITDNDRYGVLAHPLARALIFSGRIADNDDAGVLANTEALVQVAAVSFENNVGPGIDVTPAGITPNDAPKFANNDIDWPENLRLAPISRKLLGEAAPNAAVEVFRVETEPRSGNPDNGEGAEYLGTVLADTAGRFVFPDNGPLVCEADTLLTTTATLGGATSWTSEFSTNLPCVFPDPTTTDTDGDGVMDSDDACPETPPGTEVDATGCEPTGGGGGNGPPVADAGEISDAAVGEAVRLDGSASSDPDGDDLSYEWLLILLPTGSSATLTGAETSMPEFTPDVPGTFRLRLTVSDGLLSDEVEIEVIVVEPNAPPQPVAEASPQVGIGSPVVLDGSASLDPEDEALTFYWVFIEQPEESTALISDADQPIAGFIPDQVGFYRIQLTVSDGGLEVPVDLVVQAGFSVPLSFADVLCFDIDNCAFELDESAGSCTNCAADFHSGAAQNCSGLDSGLSIAGPGELSGMNCSEIRAGNLMLNCSGALCGHVAGGGFTCDGPVGGCRISEEGVGLRHECTGKPCATFVSAGAANNGALVLSSAEVHKEAIGGDGTFSISVENLGWTTTSQSGWSVTTEDGIGDKYGYVLLDDEPEVRITEAAEFLWSTSSQCSDDEEGTIIGDTRIAPYPNTSWGAIWDCQFTNTALADTDGDGWPDAIDPCSNAGTDGNACPAQHDNGFVEMFCNNPLICSLDAELGNCTDCTVRLIDGSGLTRCDAGEACSVMAGDELVCQGGCDYETPGLTGACGLDATCILDDGFSCTSAEDGTGCDGATDDGRTLGCASGQPCGLTVSPTIVSGGNTSAYLDVFKRTENGNGAFNFDWSIWFPAPVVDTLLNSGQFGIVTQAQVGLTAYRIYFTPDLNKVVVTELETPPFTLTGVECDFPDEVLLGDGGIEDVGNVNACTFVNVAPSVEPAEVRPLPDNAEFPETARNVAAGAFGNSEPMVTVPTPTGLLVMNPETGEVVFAGSARLSYVDDNIPAYGGMVQINPFTSTADTLMAWGPDTAARSFDPATGAMSWASLGFENTTDQVHLGNDITSPTVVISKIDRNQVTALAEDIYTPGQFRSYEIIERQNLIDLAGPVISSFAFDIGNLACQLDPCETSGAAVPMSCSDEIDQLLAAQPDCAEFWGTSCRNNYNTLVGGTCDLPPAERQPDFGGMVILVTIGSPGQVHLGNPSLNYFGRVATIGDVGDDPRQIRCLLTVCFVANYGSGTLTILRWDGLTTDAAITATVSVGAGVLNTSLREIGGNIVALSTGLLDNTYAVTTVAADGAVISNQIKPIIVGCENPSGLTWLEGTSQAIAMCNGNASYVTFTP